VLGLGCRGWNSHTYANSVVLYTYSLIFYNIRHYFRYGVKIMHHP
jgi:hypothetical protein